MDSARRTQLDSPEMQRIRCCPGPISLGRPRSSSGSSPIRRTVAPLSERIWFILAPPFPSSAPLYTSNPFF